MDDSETDTLIAVSKPKDKPMKSKKQRNLALGSVYPEVIEPEKDFLLPQKVKRRDSSNHYGTIPEMEPEIAADSPGPLSATLLMVPIVAMLGLALGIYEPLIVELFKSRICEYNFNFTRTICLDLANFTGNNASDIGAETTEATAKITAISGLLSSVPCLFITLFMGSWSDNFGRKLPMALPFLGFILSAFVTTLAANYPLHPYILLLSPFSMSLFGGWVVLLMAVFSYVADYTTAENRSTAVALVDGSLLVGKTAGILAGGQLLSKYGFTIPLFIFGTLPILAVSYVLVFVKERGVFGTSQQFSCAVFTTKNLLDNAAVLGKKRVGNTRKHIHLLLLSTALGLIFLGDQTALQLITEKSPFSWDVATFTKFISVQNVAVGLALALLVPLFRVLAASDIWIAIISCISAVLCSYGYAFSNSTATLLVAAATGILRNFHVVLARAMLVPMVARDELGKLMSAYATLQAIAPLFQSLFFGSIFALTVAWWPGFCFVLGSFAFVLSLAIFCYIDWDRQNEIYSL
ncbi:solute carrier family 46 member 3-like [Paramacrobiotus metropolitanus]|uniref:solute carrier family 46 member 3-like n=1 Tax=Paramacrobiotus metropolitanus TaxID=2943436 RepID=UPI0024458C63|nr:solute carrier family 46 member 3-like [Paramacrobiotus metropolitanus]